MKVLALNSSPRVGVESKTELMLDRLMEGMRQAGAEAEVINLRGKKINPCIGCYTCWTKTPGKCIHQDDMTREIFPKWIDADIAVYASPLYIFNVNAPMKAFFDRMIPAIVPFLEQYGEETYHPLRFGKMPKAVMLSVGGFPEESIFAPLSAWTKFMFRKSLLAEIYRPYSEALAGPFFGARIRDVFEATTQAGRELVKNGGIEPATMARIRQPLTDDKKSVREVANLFFRTCIAEGMIPREIKAKGIIPRPDSMASFMAVMSLAFKTEAAGDSRFTIQFHFSGEVEGSCHFRVADGRVRAEVGAAERPDLVIKTPFALWMDSMTGKADGQKAFIEQRYAVDGDASLLMKMRDLFKRD